MRRWRPLLASLTAVALLTAALAGPAMGARAEPSVTRLVATTRWVTDTGGGPSWYVLWMDAYASGLQPARQHVVCARITWSDGTTTAGEGWVGRARPGSTSMVWLQFGPIPDGVTGLTVTAQVMRLGGRDCCTPVGTQRTVTATIPPPPPPPPAASEPQVVFDVTFAAP